MDRRVDPRGSVLRGVVLPDRYEPIRRIASGGMASVWCARDVLLERSVAVKLLAQPYAHDASSGQRFKREARAAARLSGHPNVVTIYDVGEAEPVGDAPQGRPFIVMEYLAGGTVADALRVGEAQRQIVLRWLSQAASALDYAHRRGVIHRDVKLANFLLDRDRVLHVADFGIAQLDTTEDTLTGSGHVIGTAAYLAPERALGQPATEASDRYALAVTAFELLAGERPFTAENFTAQARQHVEDPPPRVSERNRTLPRALDGVLMRGMAKRPEQRFASAGELVAEIDRALASKPSRALVSKPRLAAAPAALSGGRPAAPVPVAAGPQAPEARRRSLAGLLNGRALALTALAAVLLAVAIAAAANTGGGPRRTAANRHAGGRSYLAQRTTAQTTPRKTPKPAATTTSASAPPPNTTPAKPSSPAPQPTGADALEAQGHQLMNGGDYAAAIPVLRRAVAAAEPNSLIYAYALYDLGRSLRLAGDPRAAVPILWKRLQIPNQTDTVRVELQLALRALGQQASGGAATAPAHRHGQHAGAPPPPAGGAGD